MWYMSGVALAEEKEAADAAEEEKPASKEESSRSVPCWEGHSVPPPLTPFLCSWGRLAPTMKPVLKGLGRHICD